MGARTEDEGGFRKPLGHVTNGTRPPGRFGARPGPVQPSDFYGKARSTTPAISAKRPFADISTDRRKCSIEKTLLRKPTDFRKSLRVDVCGIDPALSEDDLRNPSEWPLRIKCNLLVAIFCRKSDVEPLIAQRCRRVKTCMLEITIDDDGTVKREFNPPASIIFAPNEFYVNRRTKKPNGDEGAGDGFDYYQDFSERYRLQITIEPVGYHVAWPPVIIPPLDELDSESESSIPVSTALGMKNAKFMDLALFSELKNPLNPNRQSLSPELNVCFGDSKQSLRDRLKLQIRWALPSPISAVPIRTVKLESPVNDAAPMALNDIPPVSPSRPPGDGAMPESPANSRAQRARTNVGTYNLKALSTLAQGKSPRKRKQREKTASADASGITVTYTLGSLDATESGVQREAKVAGLKCPFCSCPNKSVDFLTFHLQNEHLNFTFQLRRGQPRVQYFLTSVKSRLGEPSRTVQFTKPSTVFELDKYLDGDESWLKSRLGPQHNVLPPHVLEGAQESSLSSSSHGSRFSSPNTSNDTDDMLDGLDGFKKPFALRVRSEKRLYVPKTDKPLFDAISKRILEPGEEYANSDDEKEESWLMLKHRDAVNDYTDLTDDEKSYINRWNPFIMGEQLTSDKYLGETLYRFVVTNKDWLVRKQSRLTEFARHSQTLKARGAVSGHQRATCFRVLRVARHEMQSKREEEAEMNGKEPEMVENEDDDSNHEEVDSKPKSPKFRGPLTCICLEHTLPSDRVICRGPDPTVSVPHCHPYYKPSSPRVKKCPNKFYHRECAKKSGRPISGNWQCDECFSSSAPAKWHE